MKNMLQKFAILVVLLLFITTANAAPDDGTPEWTNSDFADVFVMTIDSEGYLYAADVDYNIIKIDTNTGNTVDTYNPSYGAGWAYYSNMALSPDDSMLYYMWDSDRIVAIDTETMTEQWTYTDATWYCQNGLLVDKDGFIYVIDYDNIYKFDEDGNLIDSLDPTLTGDGFINFPAINYDGTKMMLIEST